jgi:hypothetical protein
LAHGDGELYRKGELNGEGKPHEDGEGELHKGELDEEREAHEEKLDGERGAHGVDEVQDPEGGLNGKGELLPGRR